MHTHPIPTAYSEITQAYESVVYGPVIMPETNNFTWPCILL